jgi:hypothetical protein
MERLVRLLKEAAGTVDAGSTDRSGNFWAQVSEMPTILGGFVAVSYSILKRLNSRATRADQPSFQLASRALDKAVSIGSSRCWCR